MLPANPQMMNQLVAQGKAKFPSHRNPGGMSYPAAKWAHDQYLQRGGQYVESKEEIDPRFRDYKKEAEDRKRRKKKEIERKKKQSGLL